MNDDTLRIPDPLTLLRESQANTAALGSLARQLIMIVKGLVILIVHGLAFGPELWFHKRFGERYLSPWMLAIAMLLPIWWYDESPALIMFWICALPALFMIHFAHRQILRRRGEVWHSRSCGEPHQWLRLFKSDWLNRMLWVPTQMLIAGGGLALFGLNVGSLFLLCGAAMVVKCYFEQVAFRERVLDTIDAQIESEHLAEAVRGESSPRQTRGLTVAGAGRLTDSELAALGLSVEIEVQSPVEPTTNAIA